MRTTKHIQYHQGPPPVVSRPEPTHTSSERSYGAVARHDPVLAARSRGDSHSARHVRHLTRLGAPG